MSFRPSCFSTKRLNPQLIRQLKDFNILKYRGKSGGTRVNKEAIKIPIINKERFIVQHNLNRRANLHNLRSLNRCSNVNICDHSERSFIPVTEGSGTAGTGLKVLHLIIRTYGFTFMWQTNTAVQCLLWVARSYNVCIAVVAGCTMSHQMARA